MKITKFARRALAAACGLAFLGATLGSVAAEQPNNSQIDALRKSLEKYEDYKVAVRDLYLSTVGCVHYSGEKKAGYMGISAGRHGRALCQCDGARPSRFDEAQRADL
jgi:hypothetical protein